MPLASATNYIRESFVDFDRGFKKAPPNLKKRLIRNVFKKIALSKDKLLLWFYLDDDDRGILGRKLKLVRDGQSAAGLSLVSGDNFTVPNLSVRGLGIDAYGVPTLTRESLFSALSYW